MSARNEGVALIIWASIMFFPPTLLINIEVFTRCFDLQNGLISQHSIFITAQKHLNVEQPGHFFQKAASMNLNSNFGTKRFKFTFGLG